MLKITYLGQCGMLLDFGHTRIVTDPYLSYLVDSFATDAVPWKRLYPPPCTLMDCAPDAVVISHSHGDHMDPWTLKPYLEAGGEALLVAPAPECGILEDLGAAHIHRARAEQALTVGDVLITPIPCAHTQLHLDDEGRFRELSYIITDGEYTVFFGGDMSLYDGLALRLIQAQPDILLLPVNGRDEARTANDIIGNIDEGEAAQLAALLSVPYIPMHHDLYAINGCSEARVMAAARAAHAHCHPLAPGGELTLTSQGVGNPKTLA